MPCHVYYGVVVVGGRGAGVRAKQKGTVKALSSQIGENDSDGAFSWQIQWTAR